MKYFLSAFILSSGISFAQIPVPEIYCNKKKVEDSVFYSYFNPVLFQIKFPEGDTTYQVKEGSVHFDSVKNPDTTFFYTSEFRTNFLFMTRHFDIVIKKVAVFVNETFLKEEEINMGRRIYLGKHPFVTLEDTYIINDNECQVKYNNKMLSPEDKITPLETDQWEVFIDGKTIRKLELILVRGIRPVRTRIFTNYKGVDEKTSIIEMPGDFYLLQISIEGYEKIYMSKVFLVE